MQRLRRQNIRDKQRAEHAILMAVRRLFAEAHHRAAALDALSELGLTPVEIEQVRGLAGAMASSACDVMPPEAPYVSAFEDRFLAMLGDRQRDPRKRVGLDVPSVLDPAVVDGVARAFNARKLRISYKSVVCGPGPDR